MERVATGIKGFDNLIEGGFPKGSAILLSGTPATGKTIFALEYLVNGARKFNERGLYVTFEEKRDKSKISRTRLPEFFQESRQSPQHDSEE